MRSSALARVRLPGSLVDLFRRRKRRGGLRGRAMARDCRGDPMSPPAPTVLAALAVSATTVAPQMPAFSSRVEAVRVDALVRERGQCAWAGAADFEVFDNGVPQQVDLVTFERLPLKAVLALDMSDSVAGERLGHLRAAGGALDQLAPKDERRSSPSATWYARCGPDHGPGRCARGAGAGVRRGPDRARGRNLHGHGARRNRRRANRDRFSDGLDTSSGCRPTPYSRRRGEPSGVVLRVGRREAQATFIAN